MNNIFVDLKKKYVEAKGKLNRINVGLKVLSIILFIITFINFFFGLITVLNNNSNMAYIIIMLVFASISLFSALAFTIINFQKKIKNLQLVGNIACLSTMFMSFVFLKDNGPLILVAFFEFIIALVILILLDSNKKCYKSFGYTVRQELLRNAKAVNENFYELVKCVMPRAIYAERENWKLLSFDDILESDLDNIIPIIDIYNNTYVAYDYTSNKIIKYNISTKESNEENNINQYLTLFDPFISEGRLYLTEWLMNEKALGKEPYNLEFTKTIRFDDNFCNIYKFQKEENGEWLIGISSNIGEFSKFLSYNKETEEEDAKALFNILHALIENQKLQNVINPNNE